MQFLHTMEDRLLDELKEITNKEAQGGEMSAQSLDNIKDIAIALNQLTTYKAMKDSGFSQNSGYSNAGYSNARQGRYNGGRMMYTDGMSREGRSYHNWDRDESMYQMRPEIY